MVRYFMIKYYLLKDSIGRIAVDSYCIFDKDMKPDIQDKYITLNHVAPQIHFWGKSVLVVLREIAGIRSHLF